MKSYAMSKPNVLEQGYNGRYLYHWNIVEVEVDDEDGTHTEWCYDEIPIYAPFSADTLLRAVINELWDKDHEQKLINDYNAYVLGVGDEGAKDAYFAFLQARAQIKQQVENDCKEYNI